MSDEVRLVIAFAMSLRDQLDTAIYLSRNRMYEAMPSFKPVFEGRLSEEDDRKLSQAIAPLNDFIRDLDRYIYALRDGK